MRTILWKLVILDKEGTNRFLCSIELMEDPVLGCRVQGPDQKYFRIQAISENWLSVNKASWNAKGRILKQKEI